MRLATNPIFRTGSRSSLLPNYSQAQPHKQTQALPEYSIQDLAREFAVTPRTLRFYEEKGLLRPNRRGRNRVYSAADRARLILILRGKRLGFALEESAELIEMYDPTSSNQHQLQALLNKIREQKVRVEIQQREIGTLLKDLTDWEARSQQSLNELQQPQKDPS